MAKHRVTTLILGAGAAGLMCAAYAGPDTLVIDHAKAPGEKIRISGGGRCNFTNMGTTAEAFLGENPHFAKSALARYTQWDFIDLVDRHGVAWHEKTLGQLFCDTSAKDIIRLLLDEMQPAALWLQTEVVDVAERSGVFITRLRREGRDVEVRSQNLVIATGGKSIPKMGATGLAYRLAAQFGHRVTETRPALVPLTFDGPQKAAFAALSGSSVAARIRCNGGVFEEGLLFTHRGLSGPAVLQISSYWREGDPLEVTLTPAINHLEVLKEKRARDGRKQLSTALSDHLPKKLAVFLTQEFGETAPLAECSDVTLRKVADHLTHWSLTPTSSEGYRTAEVTLGGIATDGIEARSLQSKTVPGLYMIGEAVDVTGWLGGYNFQWAWSSGVAAGRAIAATPKG